MTSFPPAKPSCTVPCTTPQGESGHLLPHLVGVITSVTSICSTHQSTPSDRGTATSSCLPHASAQMVPTAKKAASFAQEPQGSTSIDETTPRAMQEGPSSSKRQEAPTWLTSLKPSCAEAFLWDSSIVKEARSHFFSKPLIRLGP